MRHATCKRSCKRCKTKKTRWRQRPRGQGQWQWQGDEKRDTHTTRKLRALHAVFSKVTFGDLRVLFDNLESLSHKLHRTFPCMVCADFDDIFLPVTYAVETTLEPHFGRVTPVACVVPRLLPSGILWPPRLVLQRFVCIFIC